MDEKNKGPRPNPRIARIAGAVGKAEKLLAKAQSEIFNAARKATTVDSALLRAPGLEALAARIGAVREEAQKSAEAIMQRACQGSFEGTRRGVGRPPAAVLSPGEILAKTRPAFSTPDGVEYVRPTELARAIRHIAAEKGISSLAPGLPKSEIATDEQIVRYFVASILKGLLAAPVPADTGYKAYNVWTANTKEPTRMLLIPFRKSAFGSAPVTPGSSTRVTRIEAR